jgi:hypothetical protein
MAITARHFGYKPVEQGYNFPGYTDHSLLIVQDVAPIWNSNGQVPGQEFSGFEWIMGPDEARFDWVIAYTAVGLGLEAGAITTEGEVSTPGYEPDGSLPADYQFDGPAKKIAFRGGADADFLGAANDLTGQNFTTEAEAVTWLNSTSRATWTNHTAADEGGNKENPTDFYYEVTACGGDTVYILKTTSSDLIRFSAYEANAVLFAEGLAFDSATYVVVRPASAQAHQLLDNNPTIGNCEA